MDLESGDLSFSEAIEREGNVPKLGGDMVSFDVMGFENHGKPAGCELAPSVWLKETPAES